MNHKEVGVRLRMLRKEAGLTQREMGEKLYLSREQYQRVERGQSPITAETVNAVADYFHISTDYIYGRMPDGCDQIESCMRMLSYLSRREIDFFEKCLANYLEMQGREP